MWRCVGRGVSFAMWFWHWPAAGESQLDVIVCCSDSAVVCPLVVRGLRCDEFHFSIYSEFDDYFKVLPDVSGVYVVDWGVREMVHVFLLQNLIISRSGSFHFWVRRVAVSCHKLLFGCSVMCNGSCSRFRSEHLRVQARYDVVGPDVVCLAIPISFLTHWFAEIH